VWDEEGKADKMGRCTTWGKSEKWQRYVTITIKRNGGRREKNSIRELGRPNANQKEKKKGEGKSPFNLNL